MLNRKKFIFFYLSLYTIFAIFLFITLKIRRNLLFTEANFFNLTDSVSALRDRTEDLCKYQMLGDPDVKDQYVKVNFYCNNGEISRSTMALEAIENKTPQGILEEYARIINFDKNIIRNNNWYCLLATKEITSEMFNLPIKAPTTIDCYQSKDLHRD